MKISLVMIVKNESKCISSSVNSIKKYVDEIIVVDTGSTDSTKEIARDLGATVYDYAWNFDFAEARNYGISKSTGDWNLFLDADEVVTVCSRELLIGFANKNPNSVGSILITSSFVENNETNYSKDFVARFARKDITFTGKIHEQLGIGYPRCETGIAVSHSGYFETDKSKRNLDMLLKALQSNPKDNYMLYQTAKTLSVSKEYDKANLYFKKAYKSIDPNNSYTKGLVVSYLYNLINTRDIDLGLNIISKYKAKFELDVDFNFVCGIYYMNLVIHNTSKYVAYLAEIERCYLLCIELGESNRCSVDGVGSFKAYHNLGAYYEVLGNMHKAIVYYSKADELGYQPSSKRLSEIK